MRAISAIVAAAALAGSVAGTPASATVLTFTYAGVQTGAAPNSPAPWLTATFDDSPDYGVLLTLTASLEADTEFISRVKFNFNPLLDASQLRYTGGSLDGIGTFPGLKGQNNGIEAPGGSRFDFEFLFDTAAAAKKKAKKETEQTIEEKTEDDPRFGGVDIFVAELLYNSLVPLKASDFDFLSDPNGALKKELANEEKTPRYSLAHVQGIGSNDDSGWIFVGEQPQNGVPEPGTLALLGIAGVGLVAASRRRIRG